MYNKIEFGNKLKLQREKLGKTQEDCARACGVCREAYQKWERGLSFPNEKNLDTICIFLEVGGDVSFEN